MDRVLLTETNKTEIRAPFPNYLSPSPPLPPLLSVDGIIGRISPSILLVIVILGFIFVISGLLHLLVRYLIRRSTTDQDDQDSATALQGQLQQLFHLHDAGVDQSFIDTLPVFPYKDITGVKDPSTAPFASASSRPTTSSGFFPSAATPSTWSASIRGFSPTPPVLSAGPASSQTSPPATTARPSSSCSSPAARAPGRRLKRILLRLPQRNPREGEGFWGKGCGKDDGAAARRRRYRRRRRDWCRSSSASWSVDGASEGSSSDNRVLDGRRCFSMGSFEYVMDETSRMHVTVKQPARKPGVKKPGHRPAISECDCNPRREGLKGFETGESFSVSKIWLRSKKEKKPAGEVSSRRVFSFRLPLQMGGAAERGKVKCGSSRRTAASEVDLACYDKSGSDLGSDLEAAGCDGDNVVSRGEETPSFARRTLLWISGRHHKVGNHSESGRIPSSGPILFSNFSGDEVAEGGTK
ncbi:unnamed protein product [Spirodela intermedia]|uniref:Uncharacterized protein n=1 Tax=Spirodela intermedia TaxID=51605 RepID=A0A7I8JLL7_SPIIN|nr:unnamed protein product [Spirodela intermedia]CAA6671039.1 unnamed protein product [Spirodela intermedia]